MAPKEGSWFSHVAGKRAGPAEERGSGRGNLQMLLLLRSLFPSTVTEVLLQAQHMCERVEVIVVLNPVPSSG